LKHSTKLLSASKVSKSKYVSIRAFSSKEKPVPNLVQIMPSYQLALKLAMDKRFDQSIEKLELVLDEITDDHSNNTPYHIYTLYKMATVNNMAGKAENNESVFERIAEVAPMAYPDRNSMIYSCHDTLLKYYMHTDIDKCCKYGESLTQSKYFDYDKLISYEKYDLQNSKGIAYSLEGTSHEKSFE
jgi:hypothetical protein